jgi:hypothetical protein
LATLLSGKTRKPIKMPSSVCSAISKPRFRESATVYAYVISNPFK